MSTVGRADSLDSSHGMVPLASNIKVESATAVPSTIGCGVLQLRRGKRVSEAPITDRPGLFAREEFGGVSELTSDAACVGMVDRALPHPMRLSIDGARFARAGREHIL